MSVAAHSRDALMPSDIRALLPYATPEERKALYEIVGADMMRTAWRPLPGPQASAYHSRVNALGYGGGAGGGKTDVAIGKSLNLHQRVGYFRVDGTELTAVYDRLEEIIGTRDGFNSQMRIWRVNKPRRVQFDFGSVPNPGDERKYRGRPKDLLVIDETGEWTEAPVRFLMGWVRTTDPRQYTQTLMAFNPPTRAECRWIIDFYAPWLDPTYPVPATPGETRWFARMKGGESEVEVVDGTPFMFMGELVIPQSRTFIPALVGDNPFLYGTGYMAQLQALPEPLRSQMLYGDMTAGTEDDAMQVIPSEWVQIAMNRWRKPDRLRPMDSIGVDVARGGKDQTALARRHGMWFDEPLVYPGLATPDGPKVAGLVVMHMRDRAVIHIDVDGVGSSPYDFLVDAGFQVVGLKNATSTPGQTDASGMLLFANLRSLMWWRMREALDPQANNGIALPPDDRLKLELCMPRWKLKGKTIYIESRDELLDPKRLGKSPDLASAYVFALQDTPKVEAITALARASRGGDYDPFNPKVMTR